MNKKIIYLLPLCSILLSSCNQVPTYVSFEISPLGENVSLHTEKQTNYLHDTYNKIGSYTGNDGEQSIPNSVKVNFAINSDVKKQPDHYVIDISSNDGLESWSLESQSTSIDIYNCRVNMTYEYQITAFYKGTSFVSEKQTFKTEKLYPRNLFIEGVTNCRDLGGRGNIKQGLIYRTAEFNDGDAESLKYIYTDFSKQEINSHLKLKTEIDLRKENELGGLSSCSFNENGNYYHLPMGYSGPVQVMTYSSGDINNLARIKDFFEILANKDNYPLAFHCTFGRDRTGYMSYLVEGLCGATQEELYQDYLFSNFADVTPVLLSGIEGSNAYPQVINKEEGETLQDKFFNYLSKEDNKHPGISEETLNKVISNLCE